MRVCVFEGSEGAEVPLGVEAFALFLFARGGKGSQVPEVLETLPSLGLTVVYYTPKPYPDDENGNYDEILGACGLTSRMLW